MDVCICLLSLYIKVGEFLFLHIKFLDIVTDVKKKQTNKPLYFMLVMSRLLLRTLTRLSTVEAPIFVRSDRPSPHPEEGPS